MHTAACFEPDPFVGTLGQTFCPILYKTDKKRESLICWRLRRQAHPSVCFFSWGCAAVAPPQKLNFQRTGAFRMNTGTQQVAKFCSRSNVSVPIVFAFWGGRGDCTCRRPVTQRGRCDLILRPPQLSYCVAVVWTVFSLSMRSRKSQQSRHRWFGRIGRRDLQLNTNRPRTTSL